MLFVIRVVVGDHSRVLVTRQGSFATILGPGVHMLFGMGIETGRHSIEDPAFHSTWAGYLFTERPPLPRTSYRRPYCPSRPIGPA